MRLRRGTTLLLLGLAFAVACIAVYWNRPVEGERVTLASVRAAAIPAAHELGASATPTPPPDRQMTSQQAAASAPPALPRAPDAGVDIGQTVLFAIHGGTPKQAAQAAMIIGSCESIQGLGEAVRRLKPTSKIPAEKLTEIAAATDQHERQCQSITPEMETHLPELAEKALRAGFHDLATTYGKAVDYRPPDEMRRPLLDGLRKGFMEGEPYIASMLALKGVGLGLSAIEARAFYNVAESDEGPSGNELRRMALPGMPFAHLNADELRQAETLAEQLKKQRKKAPKRYGPD